MNKIIKMYFSLWIIPIQATFFSNLWKGMFITSHFKTTYEISRETIGKITQSKVDSSKCSIILQRLYYYPFHSKQELQYVQMPYEPGNLFWDLFGAGKLKGKIGRFLNNILKPVYVCKQDITTQELQKYIDYINPLLSKGIKFQFLALRWLSRVGKVDGKKINSLDDIIAKLSLDPALDSIREAASPVLKISKLMCKEGLWTKADIGQLFQSLTSLFPSIELLHTVQQWCTQTNQNFTTPELGWITDTDLPIDVKVAIVRAILTRIRINNLQTLTTQRYSGLTGISDGSGDWSPGGFRRYWDAGGFTNKAKSYANYVMQNVLNSPEINFDIKESAYLDQVIDLFLHFIAKILGLTIEIGTQTKSGIVRSYSRTNDAQRANFTKQMNQQLATLTKTDDKIFLLIELANTFIEFMSAELDKSELTKRTTYGDDYIRRFEAYNLSYLTKWLFKSETVSSLMDYLYKKHTSSLEYKPMLSYNYLYRFLGRSKGVQSNDVNLRSEPDLIKQVQGEVSEAFDANEAGQIQIELPTAEKIEKQVGQYTEDELD